MSSPNPESTDSESPTIPSDSSTENNNPADPDPDQPNGESSNSGEGGEEEEGECGFCLFMKAGGCKESFVAWETCVDEAEKNGEDVAMKCMEATSALKKCMEAHADYYEPILKAEKAAQEEAIRELEKEKAAKDSEQNLESKEDLQKI
ncbi:PREDICTED: uncharacterized protein LOC18610351 [Theobroma cacao]|uniref:Uncharacterized protein LOC18610351 n=2 Tax=Theobroma cacao TaxID=3641 RepID=A0AB32VWG4_THECC|nr:PREDICTED: uncharacterized protein LOC18610351 [Theobroma cacao]EOY01846.1 GCK domain-containing protein [Theobroma cacao]